MENKLLVENVSFSYKKKEILKDLSFSCLNGVNAILGNNGAGKSTLLNILAGEISPAKGGKIFLNDTSLLNCKNYPINRVGYLPQNFEIFDNVTGYDFLSHVYDLKNLPKKNKKNNIEKMVEILSLSTVIYKNFKTYSGGFKRRLGIAQAMLGEPSLILIDEPTVGLDPEQRAEFRKLMFEISKSTITLISTHIIEDVELFSDNILILKDKNISYQGSVDKCINIAKSNIFEIECSPNEFKSIEKEIEVIQQKRISNDKIKLLFSDPLKNIDAYDKAKEVSLENAYIYLQKQSL